MFQHLHSAVLLEVVVVSLLLFWGVVALLLKSPSSIAFVFAAICAASASIFSIFSWLIIGCSTINESNTLWLTLTLISVQRSAQLCSSSVSPRSCRETMHLLKPH